MWVEYHLTSDVIELIAHHALLAVIFLHVVVAISVYAANKITNTGLSARDEARFGVHKQ